MVQNVFPLRHTGMNHGDIFPQVGKILLRIQHIDDQTSCTLLLDILSDTSDPSSDSCTIYTHGS